MSAPMIAATAEASAAPILKRAPEAVSNSIAVAPRGAVAIAKGMNPPDNRLAGVARFAE
jgi:hypothetical protein